MFLMMSKNPCGFSFTAISTIFKLVFKFSLINFVFTTLIFKYFACDSQLFTATYYFSLVLTLKFHLSTKPNLYTNQSTSTTPLILFLFSSTYKIALNH